MSSILVIGATGNVGRAVIDELTRAGESVRAATRYPERMKPAANVEPVRFDYEDSSTYVSALNGAERVFLIGPPTPTPDTAVTPFLKATARPGRKFVLMTAMGADADENGSLRKVERVLEESGAAYVILRPNWFMDNFHTSYLDTIRQVGVIPLPTADSRTSLIDARDIGASAAAALRSNQFNGRAFTLTGPKAVTYAEAAAILSKASGREVQYVPMDEESFIQSSIEAGVPEDLTRYLATLYSYARMGAAEPVTDSVQELTGRPPRTLEHYAADYASAWR